MGLFSFRNNPYLQQAIAGAAGGAASAGPYARLGTILASAAMGAGEYVDKARLLDEESRRRDEEKKILAEERAFRMQQLKDAAAERERQAQQRIAAGKSATERANAMAAGEPLSRAHFQEGPEGDIEWYDYSTNMMQENAKSAEKRARGDRAREFLRSRGLQEYVTGDDDIDIDTAKDAADEFNNTKAAPDPLADRKLRVESKKLEQDEIELGLVPAPPAPSIYDESGKRKKMDDWDRARSNNLNMIAKETLGTGSVVKPEEVEGNWGQLADALTEQQLGPRPKYDQGEPGPDWFWNGAKPRAPRKPAAPATPEFSGSLPTAAGKTASVTGSRPIPSPTKVPIADLSSHVSQELAKAIPGIPPDLAANVTARIMQESRGNQQVALFRLRQAIMEMQGIDFAQAGMQP